MKAEHRKELMTNTLAHRISDAMQGMKEGPSRGTILILVVVGLIVIVILAWRYVASSAEEADSERWLRWDSLTTPAQLKMFLEDKETESHLQGRLARLEEARRLLHNGLRELGSTGARKDARDNIKRSGEMYARLVDECGDKPLLHQQVLMGAAKAHESLGAIQQARGYYTTLSEKYGDSVLGKEAGEQLQRLDEAEKNGDLKAMQEDFGPPAEPQRP